MLKRNILSLVFAVSCLAGSATFAQVTLGPIKASSPAAAAGLQPGDIVFWVKDLPLANPRVVTQRVTTLAELEAALAIRRGAANVLYKRGTQLTGVDIVCGNLDPGFATTPPPPPTFANYEIKLTTGTEAITPAAQTNFLKLIDGPGTDSNITIKIIGDGNQSVTLGPFSGARDGYQQGKDLFEGGQTDLVVQLNVADVGTMKGITISRDNTLAQQSDWQLDKVVVTKTSLPGATKTTMTANAGGVWFLSTAGQSFPLKP